MPRLRVASRMVAPSGTETARPSIVTSIWRRARAGGACGTGPRGTGINGDGARAASLMKKTPAIQRGFERARSGLPEPADRSVPHGLPHLAQHPDFFRDGTERPVTNKPLQRFLLANHAAAAGNALAAAFLAEERGDSEKDLLQIDAVIERHDDAGAERRSDGARAFECQRRIQFRGCFFSARGATE